MSEAACSFEAAVVDAARTGEWSAGLREHMHGCAACTESARVTAWLADAAARLGRARPAPDPTYIWLRAEIEKRAKEERASIRRRSGIAAVLALAAAGASAAAVLAALPRIAASARAGLSAALEGMPLVDMTVISSGSLGMLVVLAATYLLVFRPLR